MCALTSALGGACLLLNFAFGEGRGTHAITSFTSHHQVDALYFWNLLINDNQVQKLWQCVLKNGDRFGLRNTYSLFGFKLCPHRPSGTDHYFGRYIPKNTYALPCLTRTLLSVDQRGKYLQPCGSYPPTTFLFRKEYLSFKVSDWRCRSLHNGTHPARPFHSFHLRVISLHFSF